ncbi:hypothetical protein IG631_18477 [Alternaria alternata]|jgi:hypothetical protein|nr:hypothetical protein IG631_18477 [Alternaria alternata]
MYRMYASLLLVSSSCGPLVSHSTHGRKLEATNNTIKIEACIRLPVHIRSDSDSIRRQFPALGHAGRRICKMSTSPEDPKADIQSAIRSCATPQEVPRCSASDPQQVRMVTACQLPSRGTLFCDEFNNGVFISRHLRLRRIIGKPVIQGKKYAASSHRDLMFSRRTAPRAEETICTFAASHSIT